MGGMGQLTRKKGGGATSTCHVTRVPTAHALHNNKLCGRETPCAGKCSDGASAAAAAAAQSGGRRLVAVWVFAPLPLPAASCWEGGDATTATQEKPERDSTVAVSTAQRLRCVCVPDDETGTPFSVRGAVELQTGC